MDACAQPAASFGTQCVCVTVPSHYIRRTWRPLTRMYWTEYPNCYGDPCACAEAPTAFHSAKPIAHVRKFVSARSLMLDHTAHAHGLEFFLYICQRHSILVNSGTSIIISHLRDQLVRWVYMYIKQHTRLISTPKLLYLESGKIITLRLIEVEGKEGGRKIINI